MESMLLQVKRTEGVSTTDIVGRMLLIGKTNRLVASAIVDQVRNIIAIVAVRFAIACVCRCYYCSVSLQHDSKSTHNYCCGNLNCAATRECWVGTWQHFPLVVQHKHMLKSFRATSKDLDTTTSVDKTAKVSTFLPTSRRIVQFANGTPAPPGATVVYIDGGFDLFHLGHLEILKAAAKLGDYLLVGVHSDDDVTARRGEHLPIMTVHERCLSVMACSHVDEVVIGTEEHLQQSSCPAALQHASQTCTWKRTDFMQAAS